MRSETRRVEVRYEVDAKDRMKIMAIRSKFHSTDQGAYSGPVAGDLNRARIKAQRPKAPCDDGSL